MTTELDKIKSVLRSIVVSSPTRMHMRSLLHDYKTLTGKFIPIEKFGYRSVHKFLTEECSDCFLFRGPSANPDLVLIVPDTLKHIDAMVQKQKSSKSTKIRGKRTSVALSLSKTAASPRPITNSVDYKLKLETDPIHMSETCENASLNTNNDIKINDNLTQTVNGDTSISISDKPNEDSKHEDEDCQDVKARVANFLNKRIALYNFSFDEDQTSNEVAITASPSRDADSGISIPPLQTGDGFTNRSRWFWEEFRDQMHTLVSEYPDGIWATDILQAYRTHFGYEPPLSMLGCPGILAAARGLPDVVRVEQPEPYGDWLLVDAATATATGSKPTRLLKLPKPPKPPKEPAVFPLDCMQEGERIPELSLDELRPGDLVPLQLGEVYSPSHLWFMRIGEEYDCAMHDIMDEMSDYYWRGSGKQRTLAAGAINVGYYCAALYAGDWHRAVIVKVLDDSMVKVRHIDYGTVDRVAMASLRPLLRWWRRLPAMAVRARLWGVRPPPSSGAVWSPHAATKLLALVTNRPLVGLLRAIDYEEKIVELLLVDTNTDEDIRIDQQLVEMGEAEEHSGSTLNMTETYIYPTFEALENGDTPNYAELYMYIRNNIPLEHVPDYIRHVPKRSSFSECSLDHGIRLTERKMSAERPQVTNLEPKVTPTMVKEELKVTPITSSTPAPYASQVSIGNYNGTPQKHAFQDKPHLRLNPFIMPEGDVLISAKDCDVFTKLSVGDPEIASLFMADAISHAESSLEHPRDCLPLPAVACAVYMKALAVDNIMAVQYITEHLNRIALSQREDRADVLPSPSRFFNLGDTS